MSAAAEASGDQTREQTLADRVMQSYHPQIAEPDTARVRNVHVPVLSPDGRAALFLNVGGFSARDKDTLAQLVADVKDVANQISTSWADSVD